MLVQKEMTPTPTTRIACRSHSGGSGATIKAMPSAVEITTTIRRSSKSPRPL